ncbi:MAG: helix-turn-helix domain-containing protein [Nitrospirota bacterium]
MKPLREQNFYEVLEVSPDASPEQLARAYALAKRHFSGASLGSYSLFDSAERTEVLARIEEAWRTLSNREQRARYDQDVLGRAPAPAAPASTGPTTASAPTVPPSALPLSLTGVTGAALRARRESIGLPLQEIARNTRISIAYLQFIEEDHVKGLPHDAYLRGYLAQYARAVGLDPHTVADGYIRHAKLLRGQQS